ncbi:pxmp2 4 family protein 4-like, partial [Nannochloropsis oceanica]
GFLLDLPII